MGIRLTRPTEPTWIDIGGGAALLTLPPSTPIVYAARAASAALFVELLGAGSAVTKAGGEIVGLPDLTDPAQAKANQDALFVVALAELAVTDWKGVLSAEGTALEFDPGLLAVLMQNHTAADLFLGNYLHPQTQVAQEGNVSRPFPDGTLGRAGAATTAKVAPRSKSAAPRRTRKNAPTTRKPH